MSSALFDKTSEEAWIKAGRKDVRDLARLKCKQILREHAPEPLPKDVQLRLREIVKEAEKELVKTSSSGPSLHNSPAIAPRT